MIFTHSTRALQSPGTVPLALAGVLPTASHDVNYIYIRKYGNTFYVEIDQVKNDHLYLRCGNSSEKTAAKLAKTLTDKKPLLYYC